jgi:hypothetical protein
MKKFIIYNTITGKIISRMKLPDYYDLDQLPLEPGHAMLERVADYSQMVDISSPDLSLIDDPDFSEPVDTLDDLKARAKNDIDEGAGTIRGRYITSVRGQPETYMIKEAEAKAYLKASNPLASEYPMLAAEIGINGDTMADVATMIVSKANEWRQLASVIENIRLSKKKAIDEVVSEDDLTAVIADVQWPEYIE